MLPLFDMVMRAQNGAAVEAIARQFGLAQEQAAQAMAALMPAFSSGLKRSATNPYDFAGLLAAMTSGNYAQYFEDLGRAFTPQGVNDGNRILEQLFGSKEVSRAIAAQAAQITGLGQDVLKQLMPAMADTVMGGLFKQSMGQMQDAAASFTKAPVGQMMQTWLEATGFAAKPAPKPAPGLDNPFLTAWQSMLGQQAAPAPASTGADNPFLNNPFTKAWQDMLAASTGQAAPPAPTPTPPPEMRPAMMDMVNTMFDSGLEVQKTYQKNIEQIFETYLNPGSSASDRDDAPPDEEDPPAPKRPGGRSSR